MNVLRRPGERGQDLLEYALLVPVFLLTMLVILDLGRTTYYYSVIQNSAREAARYGIIHPGDGPGMEARARAMAVGVDQSRLTVTSFSNAERVVVQVRYRYIPLTPVISRLLGAAEITLQSQAAMQIEQ